MAFDQAESILPPKKQFLTEEDFDEIWDPRGLKYRVDELHVMLLNRGLSPHIDRSSFRSMVKTMLSQFFVEGQAKRDPKLEPRGRWPKVQ
jgi:hypothetical protein